MCPGTASSLSSTAMKLVSELASEYLARNEKREKRREWGGGGGAEIESQVLKQT